MQQMYSSSVLTLHPFVLTLYASPVIATELPPVAQCGGHCLERQRGAQVPEC
jgi:hypothetical protein